MLILYFRSGNLKIKLCCTQTIYFIKTYEEHAQNFLKSSKGKKCIPGFLEIVGLNGKCLIIACLIAKRIKG